jgi:glycosyltransferase involved in cell wall biosynthesis
MTKKLVSLVLPAYKEQKSIPLMYASLQKVIIEQLSDTYDFEMIFVNDGSPDGGKTRAEILKL